MSKNNTCECGHTRADGVDAESIRQALVLIGETLSLVYEKLGSYEERNWTCAVNERLHKLKALTDRMEKP